MRGDFEWNFFVRDFVNNGLIKPFRLILDGKKPEHFSDLTINLV